MGGLSTFGSIAGGIGDAVLGEFSARRAHDRDLYKMGNQYQLMMQDMKKAGLNPILAAKLGPMSIPSAQQNANSAVFANANKMENTQSLTDRNQIQNDMMTKVNDIADTFKSAWDNSGKPFVEWMGQQNWETVGTYIGEAIGQQSSKVIQAIKSEFSTAAEAIRHFLQGKDGDLPEGGFTPKGGKGQFRDNDGNIIKH